MGRRKKNIFKKTGRNFSEFTELYFNFTLKNIFHPKLYARSVARQNGLISAIGFFGINLFIFFFLHSTTNLTSENAQLYLSFYLAEAALKMFSGVLLGVVVVLLWHYASRMLGGQASFKLGLITLCFSSTPLLFYWITFLQPLIFIWFIFGLVLNFRRSYKYSLFFASLAILIPTTLVLIGLASIDLIRLPF